MSGPPLGVDRGRLSAAQLNVLGQALRAYRDKCERRHGGAGRPAVRAEAAWRAYVARELLTMIDG